MTTFSAKTSDQNGDTEQSDNHTMGSMTDDPLIPVRVSRLVLRSNSDSQWLFLTERTGTRTFPIVIGPTEAREIQRVLGSQSYPRPLTHQLNLDTIGALSAKLLRVDIVGLDKNTFFAQLILSSPTKSEAEIVVDARPSDALALGLRAGCPIQVRDSILEQARADKTAPGDGPSMFPTPPSDVQPSADVTPEDTQASPEDVQALKDKLDEFEQQGQEEEDGEAATDSPEEETEHGSEGRLDGDEDDSELL